MGKRRYWTPEESDLLRQFYPDWPTEWLAPHFGRSVRQLYQKATALGLCKPRIRRITIAK